MTIRCNKRYTVADAALRLGVRKQRIYDAMNEGLIDYYEADKGVRQLPGSSVMQLKAIFQPRLVRATKRGA